jgi:MULE transposase domain
MKRISNIMQKTKEHRREVIQNSGGQVNFLSNKLQQLDHEDPGWKYQFYHNPDGRLGRFFWMNPRQISLFLLYGEVVILDVSENRNAYNMHLTTVIVVDGENRTRNIAYCLHDRQDTDAFVWIFLNLELIFTHNENHGIQQIETVFTDRDLAIANAIQQVWPNVRHRDCLWHLHQNIQKNLGFIDQYHTFMAEFWRVYWMGSSKTFEDAFNELVNRWPAASNYLMTNLYPDRTMWAWAWVGNSFAAGLRTTGRVEGEHKNYKLLGLSRSSTLNEVFDLLSDRVTQQADEDFEAKLMVPLIQS